MVDKIFGLRYNSAKAMLVLLCTFYFITDSVAQKNQVSFEHLTVESGLSQSRIFSITQDSLGFMWFGTKDGLNRYDSQQFEVFRNHANDTTTLSSSLNINALLTDSKGNLWVGTQSGLNRYVPETKSFIRFLNHPKQKNSLSNNTIRSIFEDRQGNIWVGTENGLNRLLKDGKFERFFCNYGNNFGVVNANVKAIFQDSKNTLWLGTENGLLSLSPKSIGYKFKSFYHDNLNDKSLASNDICAITEDLNHNLWIGTRFNGLDLFDKGNNTFKHFTSNSGPNCLVNNVIRKILVDKEGLLWIATLNGISIYDPVNQKFNNLNHDPEDQNSLNQNSIYDIYEDASRSVWVGTYYGGINVYHPFTSQFKIYKHYSYKNSLSSNIISTIIEDKEHNLWIGTEAEGLNYFNRKTGVFTNFKSSKDQNEFRSNLIKAITLDEKDNLWIAAYNGGVYYFNPKTNQFKNYKLDPSNPNSLSLNRATYLLRDRSNRLWIGTKGMGLFLYRKQSDDFLSLIAKTSPTHLPSKNINYIFQDNKANLWVAAEDGMSYLPKDKKDFRRLIAVKSDFLNNISCINQTSDGKIWFGSYIDGLASYNPENKKIKFYTSKIGGLPSNNIAGIVEDNEGNLWISTEKGLAKFNQGIFNVYEINDGLPGNVFNAHSFYKNSKGELFFGGYNGMVSFFPEQIIENKTPPKMVFTHLRLFNKEVNINDDTKVLSKALSTIEEIVFSSSQNIFSIDFSALNFVKARKNRYAYKLDGFEKDWNYVSNPTATFTNLPAGEYTLFVKGTNNDGVWSNSETGLKIVIKPPFWRTWWAYIIYTFLFASLLYFIGRFLLIRAVLKREHDIHQMKLDFFTNVSHEIRTPLTLIIGPLEKLIQDTQENFGLNKQLLIVNKNAKRLMRLVNELMDFRKIESGKMKLKISPDNLVTFTKEIFLSFQQLAYQKGIDYTFICEEELEEAYFDKDQLEKVIFNLLVNAFKFAPEKVGFITVELSKNQGYIYIKVLDNGPGIPEESKAKLFTDFYQAGNHQKRNTGTGIGLALSRSIAKLHHGDLTLEDSESNTCFCLTLQSGLKHFKKEELNVAFNIDDSELYKLQSEIESIINDDLEKKKVSVSGQNPVLLVVDDNIEVRTFIEKSLNQNYIIFLAENGLQALTIATEKIPDMIISDVMMPEMDGFELCNKIKTDERTRHIPVILLTARSGDLHEIDGLKTGADAYITKPFSIQKLQLSIDNLLMLQENMRNKFTQQFTLQPSNVEIESTDEEFLNKVLYLLEENISNSEFNVNQFAAEIGMSTPVFYKKIKALTGLTVNNFVKSIRLKRAVQLLNQNAGNVSEIAYMVGFNDAKYFSKEFRKQYGKTPSAY
jgi:ligand-binding sensor domain-containing protein/signal transduction histidine kinase/DNA-binding response OmpR family regulator